MKHLFALIVVLLSLASGGAVAQTPPPWNPGALPTNDTWNKYYASKLDVSGSPSLSLTGVVGTKQVLSVTSAGYPANAPGAVTVNQFLNTINNPLTGSTTPGQGNSQTYAGLKLSNNVYGPDTTNSPPQWLGYKGSELKGFVATLAVKSPITTDTDNHKGDLVVGTFAVTSPFYTGDHTLYNLSDATTCTGPSTPYPDPGYPAGDDCWTRQMVHIENDNTLDAAIPWASWPGLVTGRTGISSATYTASDTNYSGQPTLTYTMTQSVPARMVRDYTQNPSGSTYVVLQMITTQGEATMPNPHDPYGHCTPPDPNQPTVPPKGCPVAYPLVANPNYDSSYRGNATLRNRWQILYISPDGKTLITAAPPNLGKGYGILDFAWLGHVRNRYSLNLLAQGDTNAGEETAIRCAGGWWTCMLIDTAKINGSASPGTDSNGAVIASYSVSSVNNLLYFPCTNTQTIFNIGGFVATGVDWCTANPHGPTRQASTLTVGNTIIYGPDGVAPTSVAGFPSAFYTPLTPWQLSASQEAPGTGQCPLGVQGTCIKTHIGLTQYDIALNGPSAASPTTYCTAGTAMFATGANGTVVNPTLDGGAFTAANSISLPANSQANGGTVDVFVQRVGNNQGEGWVGFQWFMQRQLGATLKFAKGAKPTPLDPDVVGGDVDLVADGTGTNALKINVTMPTAAGTYKAVACVKYGHVS